MAALTEFKEKLDENIEQDIYAPLDDEEDPDE
jgi:hypothetical protein